MSCNTFIPIMDLVREVEALLAANYIDKDDPRITGGVFTNPTIKEGFLLDVQAREEFCRLVQECGLDAPFGKMWLSRPLYPDQMFVSYEDSGEPQTKWKTIQAVLESAGVFGPAATSLSSRLAAEIDRATAAESGIISRAEASDVDIAANKTSIATNATAIRAENTRAVAAEGVLTSAVDTLKLTDLSLQSQVNSIGGGKKAYTTYALMVADKDNIDANSSIDITNDPDPLKNGTYSYDGAVFTKSIYDIESIVRTKVLNTFKTKSLMDASALPDGADAQVTDDTVNNGLYVKTAGAWVKGNYDPLAQSKSYIDARVGISSSGNLLEVPDSEGLLVIFANSNGDFFLPNMSGSVQDLINELFNKPSLEYDATNDMGVFKDSDGNNVVILDSNGGLRLTGIDGSVQDILNKLQNGLGGAVKIEGTSKVGKALYAELSDGEIGQGYSWYANGEKIEGANQSYYILTKNDLYKDISASVSSTINNSQTPDNSGLTIGGVALEQEGAVGTIYEGYKLSAGDDFTELDIIAPHKPLGRWFTTRSYLEGARGSDTLLGTMYDTDSYHLGYNDSNRGVPVGYDNMSHDGSVLTLNSRVATDYEKEHMQGNRNEVAAMINSIGAFSMFPSDANGGENILEWRVRHTLAERNPAGWHPSLWTQSSLPSVTYNSNEWDISEGNAKFSLTNYNEWGATGARTDGQSFGRTMDLMDGRWHLVSAIFSHTEVKIYLDGTLVKTIAKDANSFNEPAYVLVSSHIYSGTFSGDTYSKDEWDRLTKGASQDLDFVRLWRRDTKSHIKPLVTISPINIAYGATGALTLPSKMDLWGREDVLEHVQTVMTEENEPGGHHTQAYNSLPSFIAYDALTRTATINTANQKSGRLNFVIYGYLQDGSTCEPARTYANVAPRINVATINMTANAEFDLYAVCDCGVLVTDGVRRTKVINVIGLPDGAVYNDLTGLIYSNNAATGTHAITVQCINSVGQSTTKSINLIIA